MTFDEAQRLKRFKHNIAVANTVSHGLSKPKFRLFGISDWVWWSASALAFVLWLTELPL